MLFYRNPEKYFRGCHVRIGLFEGSELIYDDDVKGSLILIADTFYRAGFIEHWGRGIKRICDECKDNDMQNLRFEIISSDFAIIFKANYKYDYGNLDNQGSTTQKTTQKTTQIKNEIVIGILDMIKNNKYVTLQELADSLGKTRDGIKYHIAKLQSQGIIKRIGHDRGGCWKINEKML